MSHARRNKQAEKRRADVLELDVRWAYRLNRLPRCAVAASVCPCGRHAWVMPGATPAEWDAFEADELDHVAVCAVA